MLKYCAISAGTESVEVLQRGVMKANLPYVTHTMIITQAWNVDTGKCVDASPVAICVG